MSQGVYKDLLKNLTTRGANKAGAFDIPEFYNLAKELFTPEEAMVASNQPAGAYTRATADEIAKKMDRIVDEIRSILDNMVLKGTCLSIVRNSERYYITLSLPSMATVLFSKGEITEKQKKLAKLYNAYNKATRELTGPPQEPPIPIWRVIPIEETITPETVVLNYDQASDYIEKNDLIVVAHCACRQAAFLANPEDTCNAPMEVCIGFNEVAEWRIEGGIGRQISKEEAYEILNICEKAGLIHATYPTQDVEVICNCCVDHCAFFKRVLSFEKPSQKIYFSYQPIINMDTCTSCMRCIDQCKIAALSLNDDESIELDLDRCIGCGLCASACIDKAIEMKRRPGISEVPVDDKAFAEEYIAAVKKLHASDPPPA